MTSEKEGEVKVPMSVRALIKYQERLAATSDGVVRAARHYGHTDVKIKVDGRTITPLLRDDRRLMSVSRGKGELAVFSPHGPLTREELDLITLPVDSLVLGGLLPRQPVRPGDTWNPDESTLAMLLDLDSVGQSQVKAMLLEVEKGRAKIEISGKVHGAAGGVSSQIDMKSRCYYSMQSRRLDDVEVIYMEKRGASPSSPGVDVTAKLRIQLAPLKHSAALAPEVLDGVSLEPAPESQLLEYISLGRKFQLNHDRLWYVAQEDAASTVLRRVVGGDLIAQCNVTALAAIKKDRRTTLAKFQDDIKKALGDNFGQFVSATEEQDQTGRLVYRVTAAGTAAETPVEWIYYLAQDAEGRRTSAVFTMEQSLTETFAAADRPLIASLTMLSPASESPTKPTPASVDTARLNMPKIPVPPPDTMVAVPRPPKDDDEVVAERNSRPAAGSNTAERPLPRLLRR